MNWQSSTENYAECVVDDCTFQMFKPPAKPWQIFMHYPSGVSCGTAPDRNNADKRCAEMLADKRERDEQAWAALI